ncbi:MAG: dTDP-4-dehydrorhamnose reductase [Candidatus Margulisbacteria bacterium]|nr:dTDP-4-dehydrorhamnose reductase [Candidatus Margulisiibacteriota bacterium]
MTRIALVGANGMLGSAFAETLVTRGIFFTPLTKKDIDITDRKSLQILKELQVDCVINCAAYTAVDLAEKEKEKAFAVNGLGVENLALAAKDYNFFLVHYSTDYIFSGNKKEGYVETDKPEPLSVYGASKLLGEESILSLLPAKQYLLLRTAWLYGPNGKNFVQTMLNLAEKQQTIRVVDDQFGCPTYSYDLVKWTLDLLQAKKDGIYNAVNSGRCSWFEFAGEIFSLCGKKVEIVNIPSSEYSTPAQRPQYSILCNEKLIKALNYSVRNWQEALSDYLISIKL